MANIILLGTGRIGNAIALDLAARHRVTTVDIDSTVLNRLSQRNARIVTLQADLLNREKIREIIKPADIVINAVPGFMGYRTLEQVIRGGKNVVDIAFFPENALDLQDLAKQHNVTAIVDMGVAPGMSNLILGFHDENMEVRHFNCMVGGLPKYPKPPFNYKAPFSPIDVIEEYTRPARLIIDGKQVVKPALSDIESVEFDQVGTLEAFNTDGLRTLLATLPHIPNMVEKTLRYPGHARLICTLKDIGFFSETPIERLNPTLRPLDMTAALLQKHWQLEEYETEFTVMRILVSGQQHGQTLTHQYDLYDEYDANTNTTSMARTTGYACTAAVNLILEKHFQYPGVNPPERVGKQGLCFDYIMDYLKQRNVVFSHTTY